MLNKLMHLHNIILDLKTIHNNGILHKDIHPNNIFLEDLTNTHIIGFDLSFHSAKSKMTKLGSPHVSLRMFYEVKIHTNIRYFQPQDLHGGDTHWTKAVQR
ncbi:14295_t:CDS:1, partial [Gigaspora margarita]